MSENQNVSPDETPETTAEAQPSTDTEASAEVEVAAETPTGTPDEAVTAETPDESLDESLDEAVTAETPAETPDEAVTAPPAEVAETETATEGASPDSDAAEAEVAPTPEDAGGAPAAAQESAAKKSDSGPSIKKRRSPKFIDAVNLDSLPDDVDFLEALEMTMVNFEEGDIVTGTVVSVDRDEVLVDIGFKSEGVIPLRELSIRKHVNPADIVAVGDSIEALVLDKEDEDGRLVLSKKRAQYERAWGRVEELAQSGDTVEGPVIEVVKGGLIVDIGLRGFLPASLVELRRVRDLDPYIGQNVVAKVIELDRNRNNVVLSRRAYLEEEQAEERTAFLDNLAEGQEREGVVSSVVNFGAFVDLGGMDGLVHVSELSYQHVNHPSEVVKVGDKVSIKVLEVDRTRERISLSIKQTQSDPWEAFSEACAVGTIVDGKVTKTVPFGAFVTVADGVEGLVHVSEIAMHRVESPELELSLGQEVKVKVIEKDDERRRINLSIKQAAPDYVERTPEDKPARAPRPDRDSGGSGGGSGRPDRPRRRSAAPQTREFEREAGKETEDEPTFNVDSSLEAILQELKERGIGKR